MIYPQRDQKRGDQPKRVKFSLLCAGFLSWLVAVIVAPAGYAAAETPSTHLIIAGSGSNLPIIRVLAQTFQKSHPGVTIEVPASIGSSSGIRAAADGAIAIGLISRPLKEAEKGLGLTVRNFARTPMIIGAHRSVTDDTITFQELIEIYNGKKRSWKDGREIIVLTRESEDSSIVVLVNGIPGFKEVYDESQRAKRWTTLLKDQVMNETLAKPPHAVGLSDLGAMTVERHAIKPLKVNGVAPTLKNLENGKYPLYKTLTFVFLNDKLPPTAREFMAFAQSGEGKRIMRTNGYLPEK